MIHTSPTLQQVLEQAIAHHRAGQLPEAEQLYRAILQAQPTHPDANHNLGVLYLNLQQPLQALPLFKMALDYNPKQTQFWLSYLEILFATEQIELAKTVLNQAQQHTIEHEKIAFWQTLVNTPSTAEIDSLFAWFNAGEYAQAEAVARNIIAHFPQYGLAWKALGVILQQQQRFAESLDITEKSLVLLPNDPEAHYNFAVLLKTQADFVRAELHCRTAIRLQADYTPAHYTLGIILQQQQRLIEASDCFKTAIKLNPDDAEVYNNLGMLLKDLHCFQEAEQCYRAALTRHPAYATAWNNLGMVLQHQGFLSEAQTCFRRALQIKPTDLNVYDNLLYILQYLDLSPHIYLDEACQYGQFATQQVLQKFSSWQCEKSPQKLRIGFVSGDFREHVVSHFLENLLQFLDKNQIELFAYSNSAQVDTVTVRLQHYFTHWHAIVGWDDAQVAQWIHADGVHILIDLAGHTAENRLPVFAWKPAPLQISWLGYWASTGLAEMDYFLADEVGVPLQNQTHFVEKLCYLPTRLCFSAPTEAIQVSELPALTNGYMTFGCFQNLSKVNETVLKVWAKILTELPTARVRFQAKQLRDAKFIALFSARLAQAGIAPERVNLQAATSRQDYLAAHAEVDFILDTFPFSGGTTSCEALWMGVPTLTLAGETLIARQGASLLTAAGLPNWIAEDEVSYIKKAIDFAQDLTMLANLRQGLREHVLKSALFDGKAFAQHFVQLMQKMWQQSQFEVRHNE